MEANKKEYDEIYEKEIGNCGSQQAEITMEGEKAVEMSKKIEDIEERKRKEEKSPKKGMESTDLSPAEKKELDQLKKDITDRKAQLKAEGMNGRQQNKDLQIEEWMKKKNELKEKEEEAKRKELEDFVNPIMMKVNGEDEAHEDEALPEEEHTEDMIPMSMLPGLLERQAEKVAKLMLETFAQQASAMKGEIADLRRQLRPTQFSKITEDEVYDSQFQLGTIAWPE